MCNLILSNIGTFLNFVGSIAIAFSVGKHPYGANVDDKPLAIISSVKLFWIGMGILAFGFLWSICYSGYMHYK